MVAQAGQPLGWPVSSEAGSEISVWATTHENLTSGGSSFTTHWRLALCHLSLPKLTLNLLPIPSIPYLACLVVLVIYPWEARVMFDNTPLELEEIIDQCRALASTLVEMKQPETKEILTFILQERLEILHRTFHQAVAEE